MNIPVIGDMNPLDHAPHDLPYGGCQYDAVALAETFEDLLDGIVGVACNPNDAYGNDVMRFTVDGIIIGYFACVDYRLCVTTDTLTLPYLLCKCLLKPRQPKVQATNAPEVHPRPFELLSTLMWSLRNGTRMDEASWVYRVLSQDNCWKYDTGGWYVWIRGVDGRRLKDVLVKHRDDKGQILFVARAPVGYLKVQAPGHSMVLELRNGTNLWRGEKWVDTRFDRYQAVIEYKDVASLFRGRDDD